MLHPLEKEMGLVCCNLGVESIKKLQLRHGTAHRVLRSNDSCSTLQGEWSVKPAGDADTYSGDNTGSDFAQGIHWGLSSFGTHLRKFS